MVYKVVKNLDYRSCETCGHGTMWTVQGPPDDCQLGESFHNRDQAADIAELMNLAYESGAEETKQVIIDEARQGK